MNSGINQNQLWNSWYEPQGSIYLVLIILMPCWFLIYELIDFQRLAGSAFEAHSPGKMEQTLMSFISPGQYSLLKFIMNPTNTGSLIWTATTCLCILIIFDVLLIKIIIQHWKFTLNQWSENVLFRKKFYSCKKFENGPVRTNYE